MSAPAPRFDSAHERGGMSRLPAAGRLYWRITREPLYALLFVLPLVVFYELGMLLLRREEDGAPLRLVASGFIEEVLALLGPTGFWVPGLVLPAVLVTWHVTSRRSWNVVGWALPVMLVESLVLTLPLLALNGILLQVLATPPGSGLVELVYRVGAGVFEELLFRLGLLGGGLALLGRFGVRHGWGTAIAVVVSAGLFAGSHFAPLGADPWIGSVFLMRLVAGLYLGLVFIGRGLGICAGCHVSYNVILLFGSHGDETGVWT